MCGDSGGHGAGVGGLSVSRPRARGLDLCADSSCWDVVACGCTVINYSDAVRGCGTGALTANDLQTLILRLFPHNVRADIQVRR
jgi:hypothetical protein